MKIEITKKVKKDKFVGIVLDNVKNYKECMGGYVYVSYGHLLPSERHTKVTKVTKIED